MTLTVYFTVGLPGSGKSTTARQMVLEAGGSLVDVTKDELRLRPDAPQQRRAQEKWVVAQRDAIVRDALRSGRSVIVHDTNFNPVHRTRLQQIADEYGAAFHVLDFTHVPLQECIRRDAARPHPVGAAVIEQMHARYLAPRAAGAEPSAS